MRVVRKLSKIILLIIVASIFMPNAVTQVEASGTFNNAISGAQGFVNGGNTTGIFNPTGVYNALNFIYSVFLGIGIAVAVIRGMIIGLQIIVGSVQERANAKEQLIPYLWLVAGIAFGSVVVRAIAKAIMGLF